MEKFRFSKKEENESIVNSNSDSDYRNCSFRFFRIEIPKRKD